MISRTPFRFGTRSATMALGLALLTFGCGRPFDVKTAPAFIELENQDEYAFRATSPEGVVLGVRALSMPDEKANLPFWAEAITLQTRDVLGYALLEAKDVVSLDGTKGKQLRFGHDESGKGYRYWVTLFLAQGRLFIVEAGGRDEQFKRYNDAIEWMVKSVRVRCDVFLAPVLASRTCNRW